MRLYSSVVLRQHLNEDQATGRQCRREALSLQTANHSKLELASKAEEVVTQRFRPLLFIRVRSAAETAASLSAAAQEWRAADNRAFIRISTKHDHKKSIALCIQLRFEERDDVSAAIGLDLTIATKVHIPIRTGIRKTNDWKGTNDVAA